jgi:hypothetical protein
MMMMNKPTYPILSLNLKFFTIYVTVRRDKLENDNCLA